MTGDVFFVGDVGLDEYVQAERWPVLGTKVEVTAMGSYVGGMIANAACVYAGYGGGARFCWTMRPGELTDRLLGDLITQGVDTRHVARDEELTDGRTLIVLAETEHTVLYTRTGLRAIELTGETFGALCSSRYLYTSIGDMRLLRCDGLDAVAVISAARRAGVGVVLDLDVGELEPGDDLLLAHVDLLFVNRVGLERLSAGRPPDVVIGELLAGPTAMVVVTLADAGCRLHLPGSVVAVDGIAVDSVDVTGAGDTFCATFLFVLDRTGDPHAAALVANAAAARAVTGVGARAGVSRLADVLSFMVDRGLVATQQADDLAAAMA